MRGDEEGCVAINGLCTVYFVNGLYHLTRTPKKEESEE